MTFLKNTWYVAAWATEIKRELLPRTILENLIIFYRKMDGSPAAIGGVCPHRFAPLRLGHLRGDNVQCIYHGLQFDSSGSCAFSPIDKKPPRAAKVKSYPLIERYGIIWIWMGDPSAADDALIPDFSYLLDSKRKVLSGLIYVKANYELIVDNLADLTHPHFVHSNFLHTESTPSTKVETWQEANTIFSNFLFPSGRVTPSHGKYLGNSELVVDRWSDIRWDPPGNIRLDGGSTPAGTSREAGVQAFGTHLLTPETKGSTHYFFAHARSFKIDDSETDQQILDWQRVAFTEQDQPIVEAQQKLLNERDLMEANPVLLRFDQGAVAIRRVMRALIAAEDNETVVPAKGQIIDK